jgi:transposase
MNNVDGSRLEQFRQFKDEIRGSTEYLIVGIDVAKEKHHAFFGTATGKTLLKRLIFGNDLEGFRKLLEREETLRVQYGLSKVVFGLEPTGNYHKPLGEHLIRCGKLVVLVGGVAVSRNRELLDGRWDSNDTKDSANAGDLVSQGKCMFYELPALPLRDLRELLSLQRNLKRQEHGCRVRIRNGLAAQYFPELDRYLGPPTQETLCIVKDCLDPSAIAGMEFDEFKKRVTTREPGIAQRRRLEAIHQAAVDSVGCEMGDGAQFEGRILVEALKRIREEIGGVSERIERICLEFPEYECLLSIPGFGPDISAQVLGAIGDPHRFQSAKQVLKMAGLDLNADRSGKTSEKARPVISKRGRAHLRFALVQAALVGSTHNEHLRRYYTSKLVGRQGERGIHTKMRVKLAAKLLVIAWTLMKKQEAFDPKYLKS